MTQRKTQLNQQLGATFHVSRVLVVQSLLRKGARSSQDLGTPNTSAPSHEEGTKELWRWPPIGKFCYVSRRLWTSP